MKTKYLLICLIILGASNIKAQDKDDKNISKLPMSMLNTEQRDKVKEINKKYVEDVQRLLKQQVVNPLERKEKVQKLRTSRDSTLVVLLGTKLYNDYMKKAVVKR